MKRGAGIFVFLGTSKEVEIAVGIGEMGRCVENGRRERKGEFGRRFWQTNPTVQLGTGSFGICWLTLPSRCSPNRIVGGTRWFEIVWARDTREQRSWQPRERWDSVWNV